VGVERYKLLVFGGCSDVHLGDPFQKYMPVESKFLTGAGKKAIFQSLPFDASDAPRAASLSFPSFFCPPRLPLHFSSEAAGLASVMSLPICFQINDVPLAACLTIVFLPRDEGSISFT
jgi:hypothetical protein